MSIAIRPTRWTVGLAGAASQLIYDRQTGTFSVASPYQNEQTSGRRLA